MDGGVFQTLLASINLPENYTREKLSEMMMSTDKTPEELSLDELRLIVAGYMQDLFLEINTK